MAKQYVENTSNLPKMIDGKLVMPGTGVFVEVGGDPPPPGAAALSQPELDAVRVSGATDPVKAPKIAALVSGAGNPDAAGFTLTTAHANTGRTPTGTLTYTADASTGWAVSDGIAVWLPTSGTISFAVSGGATLNGATTTLTRTLAGNPLGYVVLSRIQGTNAYSLSGA